jgi:ribosomal protein L7/L12
MRNRRRMGFLRKTIILGTGGLAPIKSQSYRERTAKAGEKQLKVQQQLARQQQTMLNQAVTQPPHRHAARVGGSDADASFAIVLEDAGKTKIQVIKVVRSATGLGLKEAKALVDSAPSIVMGSISYLDASRLRSDLEAAGASVKLEERAESTPNRSGTQETGRPLTTGEAAPATIDPLDQLRKLGELHRDGVLSDAEFEAKKKDLLERI